jgi:RND superfamily putative drug exporter
MEQVTLNPASKPSIFARLGHLSYRYRVLVIVISGTLLLLSLALTPRLDSVLKGIGIVYEAGEANRAEQLLQQELKINPDALSIVFQSSNGHIEQYQLEVEQINSQVRSLSAVSFVASTEQHPEYRSTDGSTEYSIINLKSSASEAVAAINSIKQVLTQSNSLSFKTYLTGKPVVDIEAQRISKADLSKAEAIALPLTLIALLFVFGSAVAAAIPVAMGIMTVSITLGLLSLLTLRIDLSVFALNITSMLGLGLGIDYSLLIVNRFREELLVGSVEQAVVRTVDTAGRSVFFSGLTVCIGLISLLIFPILLLRSFGIAGSIVVMLSVVAALTLLPALLAILGERVNLWHVVRLAPQRGGVWTFFARKVMRYSVPAVAVVLVIVAVLASPFREARFGLGDASVIPRDVPAREGVEVLKQAFGSGEISPLLLAVSSAPGVPILSRQHIPTLYNLVNNLKTDSRIAKVRSIVNIDPRLSLANYQQLYSNPKSIPLPMAVAVQQLSSDSTTLIVVNSRTDSNDTHTRDLVKELRTLSLDGLNIQVGGQPASQVDTIQVVRDRFPFVVAAIMVVTFVVLCTLLNSVVLPLKAIIINVLSIGASFGALVFIFQEGNFHTWLNFTPVGYLDILLPVILFCVLFGLSMDYEVFLLSRIKEAYDRSGDNSLSIVEGLERTGRIITSAALLMIIVTGAFALTRIIFVKALGLGIAMAVLIDATLIRAILVPASMHLLGKWNWWTPKFLRLKRINLKLD